MIPVAATLPAAQPVAPPARGDSTSYRPDVDGLRAVAIMAVLVFHAFPSWMPGGFIGVDIFFVISGYLITSILVHQFRLGSAGLGRFYTHRATRIFPALIAVLVACFVAAKWVLLPDDFQQVAKHVGGGAAFVQNLVLWSESGYFDTASDLKPLLHLWSLAVEEQFYLAYPLILWAAWRRGIKLIHAIGAMAVASFVASLVLVRSDTAAAFFMPHTRFWELMVGGALAVMHAEQRAGTSSAGLAGEAAPWWRSPDALSLLGGVLLAASLTCIDGQTPFPGAWALLPVMGTALLIGFAHKSWMGRLLSLRVMVWLGLISYPLYLWHWPLLVFARVLSLDQPSGKTRLAAVGLSVVLAWLTYRYLERPFSKGPRTPARAAMLAGVLALVGVIGFVSSQGVAALGEKNPNNDFLLQLRWTERDNFSPECRRDTGLSDIGYCLRTGARSPDAMLIGDSHGNGFYWGLAGEYERAGKSLMSLGGPGCPPFLGLDAAIPGEPPMPCRRWMGDAYRLALETPSVRQVFLVTYALRNTKGDVLGMPGAKVKRVQLAADPAVQGTAAFAEGFRQSLRRLTAAGKQVIVVIDWPELSFDPRTCYPGHRFRLAGAARSDCTTPRELLDARNAEYRALTQTLADEFPMVRWVDPWPHLCDASSCKIMLNGQLAYRDAHHLSKAGAAHLAAALRREMLPDSVQP